MRRLRIGITVGLRSADESLRVNGIKQNALFQALALRASPWQHAVTLVNTTPVDVSGALPWPRERFPTAALADVIDELDVLIELGGPIDRDQTERLRSRGTRLVSHCCGSEYVAGVQAMLFDRPPRVAVMEPNIDVIKSCIVRVFGVEHAYRRSPDAIAQLVVCNALALAQRNPEFQLLMNQLNIVRDGKALFTDRHVTAPFLASQAEAIVSRQWENPLNCFAFDVA